MNQKQREPEELGKKEPQLGKEVPPIESAPEEEMVRLEPEKPKARFSDKAGMSIDQFLISDPVGGEEMESFGTGEQAGEHKGRQSWMRPVLIVIGTLMGYAVISWGWNKLNDTDFVDDKKSLAIEAIDQTHQRYEQQSDEARVTWMAQEIEKKVSLFFSAGSVTELARASRQEAGLLEKMEVHYAGGKRSLPVGRVKSTKLLKSKASEATNFWYVEVEFLKGPKQMIILAEQGGQLGVDWDFYVAYQEAEWSYFKNCAELGRGGEFTQRVKLYEDAAYLGGYDEDRYLAFRLQVQGLDYPLFAYVSRSHPQYPSFQAIAEMWKDGLSSSPMLMLKLKPVASESLGVTCEILGLESLSWVK